MNQFKFRRIMLPPGLIAAGAGKNDLTRSFPADGFNIVADKILNRTFETRPKQGKTTAPLLFSKQSEIKFDLFEYFGQVDWDSLSQRKIRGHTSWKINHLGLLFDEAMVRWFIEILNPFRPFLHVLVKNVTALKKIFENPVVFFGVSSFSRRQIMPDGKPQVSQFETHGADFLAVPAKRASKNGLAEFSQPFR
jgi:hypothetical protein